MPISIFLVDDHQVFQDGIASLISFEKDMTVSGKASSVEAFMREIHKYTPDLVLMDISLGEGSGIKAAKWYKAQRPDCKILMLSMHREEKYVREVLDAGADGFLLKDAGTKEMMNAIRTVAGGNPFYSQEIFQHIVTLLQRSPKDRRSKSGAELTRRELEVIKLIAGEKSNQEIADELFISIRTVDTHRQNLLAKTGARNTAGLVKYALRNKLIKL
jgi:DNA-binding NarL/FixJ family response regulator